MEPPTVADHYDAQALVPTNAVRSTLQRFHNEAKRQLLATFGHRVPRLLDLACGRGGDIHKWRALGIGCVTGLDVSASSIDEARARSTASAMTSRTTITFKVADVVSDLCVDSTEFDVVSCFFAMHYFFKTEKMAHDFMRTVASHLRRGGHFVGIVAYGKHIVQCVKHADEFDNGVVSIKACWVGAPQCFGSAYTFAVKDTVTEESRVPEYLVFSNVLEKVARMHGLKPVAISGATAFSKAQTQDEGILRPLNPTYDGADAETTRMYAGFAFQKM